MTTRAELRDLAALALRTAFVATNYDIRTVSVLPISAKSIVSFPPTLYVAAPAEQKESTGRAGPPKFFVTTTLVVVIRIAAVDLGQNENTVSVDMDAMIERVHDTVLGDYQLLRVVQQFAHVETEMVIDASSGTPIAEAHLRYRCELFQTYQPPLGDPLTLIDATLQTPAGQPLAEAAIALPQT